MSRLCVVASDDSGDEPIDRVRDDVIAGGVRFATLGSGSKGNCTVVQGGGVTVLIDAGYTPRETKRRLLHLGLTPGDLAAILVTHGHGDHVRGARGLARATGIPTWTSAETQRFVGSARALENVEAFVPGTAFAIGGLSILPVRTPHDAPGSVCFVIDDGAHRFGICTDLGAPTRPIATALRGCHTLVLEHNHDPQMLANGPYSAHLKRRVASPRGHLSNEDGARLLAAAKTPDLGRVLLAHLSEVNNTPALALAAARAQIDGADVALACAPQHHPTDWLPVKRPRDATVTATAASSGASRHDAREKRRIAMERQLSLFDRPPTPATSAA